ncbi:hypothetical protein ACIQB4_25815 [Streptomyces griseoluteus]|uniref:hypothetical protein n=1 Tax=Streptomyces griseoluteus TaxID=29306 RepID=UPI00380BC304
MDAADPAVVDPFAADARMFFPKFGFATRRDRIGPSRRGWARGISKTERDIAGFNVLSSGNFVVVEGAVKRATTWGVNFPDGVSSYGLFCDVFGFSGERISRVHIYKDPDFATTHAVAVAWGESVRDGM